jgi:hypothetical protein
LGARRILRENLRQFLKKIFEKSPLIHQKVKFDFAPNSQTAFQQKIVLGRRAQKKQRLEQQQNYLQF